MITLEQHAFYIIDYHTIDDLVYKHYGKGNTGNKYHPAYEFAVVGECSNDSCHQFLDVHGKDFDLTDKFYADSITRFRKDGTPGDLDNHLILCILCADGHIPAGDYLVEVCW